MISNIICHDLFLCSVSKGERWLFVFADIFGNFLPVFKLSFHNEIIQGEYKIKWDQKTSGNTFINSFAYFSCTIRSSN